MKRRSIALSSFTLCMGAIGFIYAAETDEPSRADLMSAIEGDIVRYQTAVLATTPNAERASIHKTAIHDVSKLACNRQSSSVYPSAVYSCTVHVDMTVPFVGRTGKPVTASVTRFDTGWVLVSL